MHTEEFRTNRNALPTRTIESREGKRIMERGSEREREKLTARNRPGQEQVSARFCTLHFHFPHLSPSSPPHPDPTEASLSTHAPASARAEFSLLVRELERFLGSALEILCELLARLASDLAV